MPRPLLITICILALASVSNTNSFGLVFARAAEGLGIEVAALGGLRTIENGASIVAALIVAPLIDRFPRKWLLLSGFGMATVSVFVLVVLDNIPGTIIFFALNGAAMMQIFGALMAMPSDFVDGRQLNRMMGLIIGCIAFTAILVAPVVGNVAENYGWKAGMVVSSGVTGLALLLTILVIPTYRLEATQETSGGFIHRYRAVLDRKPLLIMLGSNMLRFAQLSAILTFLSSVFIIRYELSLSVIGLITSGVGIMFFCSSLVSGILLHWLRTFRILVWGGCLAIVLLALMFVAELPLIAMIPTTYLFIIVIAAQENTGTIAALRLAGHARGAAMSWNEVAAGVGALIGIGSGSIGLALLSIQGLGIALTIIATVATAVSFVAISFSGYRDEGEGEPDHTSNPAQAPAS
jgi:predicted MFS family arabinose efflux permease